MLQLILSYSQILLSTWGQGLVQIGNTSRKYIRSLLFHHLVILTKRGNMKLFTAIPPTTYLSMFPSVRARSTVRLSVGETPQADDAGKYKIYGKDGRLVIEVTEILSSPVLYSVYSVDGTIIEQESLTTSHSIPMPSRGIYIVRVGNTIHKIWI